MCTEVWWENLSERDHLEDQGIDGRIIIIIIIIIIRYQKIWWDVRGLD